jgi:hypothetical protein
MAGGSSSEALPFSVPKRTIRFRLGAAPNAVSGNTHATPSKPPRGGKTARH